MLELYSTPLDILYLILSIVIGLLGIFLVLALFHIVRILSNVHRISTKAKDTMDLVNHYLWQPIKFAMMIIEKGKEVARHQAQKNSKKD